MGAFFTMPDDVDLGVSQWPEPESGLERRTATVCGYQLSYVTGGQGDAVILLHGLGAEAATWRRVMPALAERYTVYALDMFGCGESENPPIALTIEAQAHYVRLFMDAVGIRRAHLIGHSLGGGVAMQTLHFSPDRVDRLVLVDSGGLGRDVHWLIRISTLPGAEQVIGVLSDPRSGVIRLTQRMEQRASRKTDAEYTAMIPGVLSKLREMKYRGSFLRMVRAIGSLNGQTVSALPHLPAHTDTSFLFIWGSADPIIPVKHGHAAQAHLPKSHMVVIPGCFHQPHLEAPQEFLRLAFDFLEAESWPPATAPEPEVATTAAPHKRSSWRWLAPAAVALTGIPTAAGIAMGMALRTRKRVQVAGG